MTTATTFAPGDVVTYRSERQNRWCREGKAIAEGRGEHVLLIDTYWQGFGSDNHILTDGERATAKLLFNLTDFDELPRNSQDRWQRHAPQDRQLVTSQHGLQIRYFIRKGAVEHLPTQVETAREALQEAESDAALAARKVVWRQEELAALETRLAESVGGVQP